MLYTELRLIAQLTWLCYPHLLDFAMSVSCLLAFVSFCEAVLRAEANPGAIACDGPATLAVCHSLVAFNEHLAIKNSMVYGLVVSDAHLDLHHNEQLCVQLYVFTKKKKEKKKEEKLS
ncbi:hypothetical protein HBI56_049170 [Parastagonospora nodorum]|uniref:Uncharacterized protein n=1 Tax=Phaeosphaeria nodorum (strain SN15 / ATCC MYA-4574 / FGSC 10173) TaxID=321614 RepID=A0A7U2HX83_PHANO|nr:hypothetical protein HBH56_062080 [Parastagonospora nodorum]QRC92026.1 hypothetical protein JI435_021950 [Parastagonospora nodorum SN15]KAH3930994.1 hypothetical protein HBH54_106030 [Parastagonospora nodorum]KAH3977276.1 hypothetical protein HBH52_115130 [Parastagonospora nodorum]KAH4140874.1 hypothetical protein HBH45_075670 [Parastagonospora nodorum]